jgi:hypothetical protein
MKTQVLTMVLAFGITLSFAGQAQQSLQLEGTEITGNKELPMVLYIVPWKSAERFDIQSPPITSVMDAPLTTIDRPSFKRTVNYHQAIYQKPGASAPASE